MGGGGVMVVGWVGGDDGWVAGGGRGVSLQWYRRSYMYLHEEN